MRAASSGTPRGVSVSSCGGGASPSGPSFRRYRWATSGEAGSHQQPHLSGVEAGTASSMLVTLEAVPDIHNWIVVSRGGSGSPSMVGTVKALAPPTRPGTTGPRSPSAPLGRVRPMRAGTTVATRRLLRTPEGARHARGTTADVRYHVDDSARAPYMRGDEGADAIARTPDSGAPHAGRDDGFVER